MRERRVGERGRRGGGGVGGGGGVHLKLDVQRQRLEEFWT